MEGAMSALGQKRTFAAQRLTGSIDLGRRFSRYVAATRDERLGAPDGVGRDRDQAAGSIGTGEVIYITCCRAAVVNVRFGSLADMCNAKAHVRFASNSDRESGFPQTAMSASPPKADMCAATTDVCKGPIADTAAR